MANVAIIDDSDSIRMVLKDILVIGKHNLVSESFSSIGVLEEYIKSNPDIILLDIAMPKKDGISVLKEILEFNPSAKVIMVSASDNQHIIKECMRIGAKAYILKPFNFQEVLDIIADVTKS